MSDETGGPAFPCGYHPEGNSADQQGMTLLDWFAGQALSGLMARDNGWVLEAVADESYIAAKYMLAEKAMREATCKDGLQVPDHSPDAGKMAGLEEENRELAQALIRCVRLLEVIPEAYVNSETGKPLTHSPDGALANANAVIAKLKNHRRGAGHE